MNRKGVLFKKISTDAKYAARVVSVDFFTRHPDEEVTRIKIANVLGYKVIVPTSFKKGLYLFFPSGCCIADWLLRELNLYKDSGFNKDITKSGVFYADGIVRAIKIKGIKNEGYLISYIDIVKACKEIFIDISECPPVGSLVDAVESDDGISTVPMCYKNYKNTERLVAPACQLVCPTLPEIRNFKDLTWDFTRDTELMITKKLAGVRGFVGNIKVPKPMSELRRAIRNSLGLSPKRINKRIQGVDGYADSDDPLFADDPRVKFRRHIASTFENIPEGTIVLYVVVGYYPDGTMISEHYDYGCIKPSENDIYREGVHFKVFVYGIISTIFRTSHIYNPELTRNVCAAYGWKHVPILYIGSFRSIFPKSRVTNGFKSRFVELLAEGEGVGLEEDEAMCTASVATPGIMIRTMDDEDGVWYRMPSFRFLKNSL